MEPTPSSASSGNPRKRRFSAALLLAMLAILLVVGQWYDGQRRFKALRQQANMLQVQLAATTDRLREAQGRQAALESLYQELSRGNDDSMFVDIEQTLLIADQQLQIADNVKTALAALQAADAQLARSNRPEFAPVRKALAHDIERLQRAPAVDVASISAQLDSVLGAIDTLPLAIETRPSASPSSESAPAAESTWQHVMREIWRELRSLIRIQNTGHADVALLAPEQIFFLRENLKLRLLDARLALLAHDETSFKADLKAAQVLLARYFALQDPAVDAARATAQQLARGSIGITPPDLAASLAAVRDYRLAHGQP